MGDTLDNNYGLMDVFYDMGLCRELTAVAHAVPVHSTPGLSKYVIVIVVEDPLVVVIAHGPAQTKQNNNDSNIVTMSSSLTQHREAHQSSLSSHTASLAGVRSCCLLWCTGGSRGQETSQSEHKAGSANIKTVLQTWDMAVETKRQRNRSRDMFSN